MLVRGINLDLRFAPPVIALQDYPSVREQPKVAAAELDRLASLGGIHWYEKDCAPPDLRVCPSQLIAKGDKVRAARDWSNRKYGLNGALLNPPVKNGDMGAFLRLLSPGAFSGGIDSRGCFLHWLVYRARRHFLGVRNQVSGRTISRIRTRVADVLLWAQEDALVEHCRAALSSEHGLLCVTFTFDGTPVEIRQKRMGEGSGPLQTTGCAVLHQIASVRRSGDYLRAAPVDAAS